VGARLPAIFGSLLVGSRWASSASVALRLRFPGEFSSSADSAGYGVRSNRCPPVQGWSRGWLFFRVLDGLSPAKSRNGGRGAGGWRGKGKGERWGRGSAFVRYLRVFARGFPLGFTGFRRPSPPLSRRISQCRGLRGSWGSVKPVSALPGMVPWMAFLRGFRTVCPRRMPGRGEGALAVAGGGGRAGVSWGR